MSDGLMAPVPPWPLPLWILSRAVPMALSLWPLIFVRIAIRLLATLCLAAAILPPLSPWPIPGTAASLVLAYLGLRWLCWGRAGMLGLLRDASWHPEEPTRPRFRWRVFKDRARSLLPRVAGINAMLVVTLANWACAGLGTGFVLLVTDAIGTGPMDTEAFGRGAVAAAVLGLLAASPLWMLLRATEALAVDRELPVGKALFETLSLARRRPGLLILLTFAAALAAGIVGVGVQVLTHGVRVLGIPTSNAIAAGILLLGLASIPLEHFGAVISATVWMGLARCTHPHWPGAPNRTEAQVSPRAAST